MKHRRFRLKYSAPMNSQRWKCDWINCTHGMGLAGMGVCSAHPRGEWWNSKCLQFETDEEFMRRWKDSESKTKGCAKKQLYFRNCCGQYKKPTELCCWETK